MFDKRFLCVMRDVKEGGGLDAIQLAAHAVRQDRPWIRGHVPVRSIRNTCESIVPRKECRCETEATTGVNERWLWCAFRCTVEVANSEHEEGQVEGEEEQEESDSRFERAEQENEGENEPALFKERVKLESRVTSKRRKTHHEVEAKGVV